MPTDRTDDVLTAEERAIVDAWRRNADRFSYCCDAVAIIDRLSARLAAAESVADALHKYFIVGSHQHFDDLFEAAKAWEVAKGETHYRGVIGTDPPICKMESWIVGTTIASMESTSSTDGPKVERLDDSSTPNDGIDKEGG